MMDISELSKLISVLRKYTIEDDDTISTILGELGYGYGGVMAAFYEADLYMDADSASNTHEVGSNVITGYFE